MTSTRTPVRHPGLAQRRRPGRAPRATAWTALLLGAVLLAGCSRGEKAAGQGAASAAGPAASAAPRPSLTVSTVTARSERLPRSVPATGSLAAWQEASVGAEGAGWRLAEVLVNVGDRVRKGQVLARFAPEMVRADAAQIDASVAEAEARLADARANAQRARELEPTGALSAQQIQQYLTGERTARAQLEARRAAAAAQRVRLGQTTVLAPDDGLISVRNATVGAVVPAGQELFRLIRQGRLEWRAEIPADDLAQVRPGQSAEVVPNGLKPLAGTVRTTSPAVNPMTRQGMVYVDLPATAIAQGAKAGMFARGELRLAEQDALTLPQSAVLLRDGRSLVFEVGPDSRVKAHAVTLGSPRGDRVEVREGLAPGVRVVASGAGFLADGDVVRVVDAAAAAPAPASMPASR